MVEDRAGGGESRTRGLGNLSGNAASPTTTMIEPKKQPDARKVKVKRSSDANKPNPKHKKDFEGLLDLAVRRQK